MSASLDKSQKKEKKEKDAEEATSQPAQIGSSLQNFVKWITETTGEKYANYEFSQATTENDGKLLGVKIDFSLKEGEVKATGKGTNEKEAFKEGEVKATGKGTNEKEAFKDLKKKLEQVEAFKNAKTEFKEKAKKKEEEKAKGA